MSRRPGPGARDRRFCTRSVEWWRDCESFRLLDGEDVRSKIRSSWKSLLCLLISSIDGFSSVSPLPGITMLLDVGCCCCCCCCWISTGACCCCCWIWRWTGGGGCIGCWKLAEMRFISSIEDGWTELKGRVVDNKKTRVGMSHLPDELVLIHHGKVLATHLQHCITVLALLG